MLKIPEINIVLCNVCRSADPGGRISEQGSPTGNALRSVGETRRGSHNPGNSSQKYLLFCSSEEMRVREEEGRGGVCWNHHGNFNNTFLPVFFSHTHTNTLTRHTTGNEFQNEDSASTINCFFCLFLTPAGQHRRH